jgi:hypothetical protein
LGLEKPNSGLDPGETFFLTALAISVAPRLFKFREMSVSLSTRTFVFSIHSLGGSIVAVLKVGAHSSEGEMRSH